jgi:hypothetical protein
VLLREPTASYWTDATLLVLANLSIDEYVMVMIAQDEGWMNDTFETSLVAGEVKYALPEGTGTIRSVSVVSRPGTSEEIEIALTRNDQLNSDRTIGSEFSFSPENGPRPTYRLVGNLIYLSLAPEAAVTNGLKIEGEFAPARLTGDGSVLDKRFPDVFETLLSYDVAVKAFELLAAQGDSSATGWASPLKSARDAVAARYFNLVARRQKSRTFSGRFSLGS